MAVLESRRKWVRELYRDVDGYRIPNADLRKIKAHKSAATYGEMTLAGAQMLLKYLRMTDRDVFFDLGSGVGKVVVQAAISVPLKKCVGIELSRSRFRDARQALQYARKLDLLLARRCLFRNESFLKSDLSDATVLYTCSTSFSDEIMASLTAKIAALNRELTFVTLQKLGPTPAPLAPFRLVETLVLPTNWNRKSKVFVYRVKPRAHAPAG